MTNEAVKSRQYIPEFVSETFLEAPSEESFATLFKTYSPQLVAFFKARGCDAVAEDLAQDVMLTVFRKAGQIRDHALFRAWVFAVARNALCRHWGKRAREVETVDLAQIPERLVASKPQPEGTTAFEFHRWMAFLDSPERQALTLRFIEELQYHEIAAAETIPIGTAQWRVFNAKKKLAHHLRRTEPKVTRKAA
jgi:RNA polymerase sigma-70 factor (ECF subfamily)